MLRWVVRFIVLAALVAVSLVRMGPRGWVAIIFTSIPASIEDEVVHHVHDEACGFGDDHHHGEHHHPHLHVDD